MRTSRGKRKEFQRSLVPPSSPSQRSSSSCAAIIMLCMQNILASPQHVVFSVAGLHSTCCCIKWCVTELIFTEMWEPCVRVPLLRAVTVQHHPARAAPTARAIQRGDPGPHSLGLSHAGARDVHNKAMTVGSTTFETFQKCKSGVFLLKLIRAGLGCTSVFTALKGGIAVVNRNVFTILI